MSEFVYAADGLTMIGYLARPDGGGPWLAVLIGHDGVGLESHQSSRADALAECGYIAFAMDFHGGEVFMGRPDETLARTLPILADIDRVRAIGRAALDQIFAQPGVDFQAMALVHPGLPDPGDDGCAGIRASISIGTGSEDPIITPGQVLDFGEALQRAGLEWRANIDGGAKHAFWAQEAIDRTGLRGYRSSD